MTAIVAYAPRRGVGWIAGDRGISDEYTITRCAQPKIVAAAGGWLAFAGDVALAQRATPMLAAELERHSPSLALRRTVAAHDLSDKLEWLWLSPQGQLHHMAGGGAHTPLADRSASIGDGGGYAMAALRAQLPSSDPPTAMRRALKIAAKMCLSVLGPFDVRGLS